MTPTNLTECLAWLDEVKSYALHCQCGPAYKAWADTEFVDSFGSFVASVVADFLRSHPAQPPLREAPANESRRTDGGEGLKVLRGEDPGVIAAMEFAESCRPQASQGSNVDIKAERAAFMEYWSDPNPPEMDRARADAWEVWMARARLPVSAPSPADSGKDAK